jgi:signal transduction histidine kinase
LIQPEARAADVNVGLNFSGDLPLALLDGTQVQQVLVNLERNSIDALKEIRGKRRDLMITTSLQDAQHLRVSVSDNGPGLDSTLSKDLFKPYVTTKSTGMGLVLSISRSIVEAHGGNLWVDTEGTVGATFHFTIPIAA